MEAITGTISSDPLTALFNYLAPTCEFVQEYPVIHRGAVSIMHGHYLDAHIPELGYRSTDELMWPIYKRRPIRPLDPADHEALTTPLYEFCISSPTPTQALMASDKISI